MSVIDRLRKRRKYPVEIDGDTVHIRALLESELKIASDFRDDDESIGYAIGCAVLNDDGSQVFVMESAESSKQFGARVLAELDMPSDTKAELTTKILKLSQGPLKPDDLKKN